MNGHSPVDLAWLAAQFPDLQGLAPLTQGGFKQVFAATHPTDGRVVLKIIHPRQSIESTQRELLAVKQLSGSRVPEVFESGTLQTPIGDCFWFREQCIEGKTLRERIQSGALSIHEVLRLGYQILETLVASEKVHIVHRDVKPENIIIDGSGNFWLIDFGVARHLDLTSLTGTASPFGKFTPGYAPPEQIRNVKDDIDHRCDLFAIGVTMYEAANAVNPFTDYARDVIEILRRVETIPLPPLMLGFNGQASLADLVNAMTQRRRDHRPSSVAEAFDWIKRICAAEGL